MNPLNSNPFATNFNPPPIYNRQADLMNNVKHVKSIMKMAQGDPQALMRHFPMLKPILQMAQGQDLKTMFLSECQKQGIDPNVILNELRN